MSNMELGFCLSYKATQADIDKFTDNMELSLSAKLRARNPKDDVEGSVTTMYTPPRLDVFICGNNERILGAPNGHTDVIINFYEQDEAPDFDKDEKKDGHKSHLKKRELNENDMKKLTEAVKTLQEHKK